MNVSFGFEETKLEKLLAEIEKEHPIHNDEELMIHLDTIIATEKDQDIVKEAIKFYFYIKGYNIDEMLGCYEDEKKRLLEGLK